MGYVFFGGMRGTAWVNAFQATMFLSFGAIALIVIGRGMGGFSVAMESLLAAPGTAPLLTRERISPQFFFSYTFIPLSTIAFPHITIFCLTARRMAQFKPTVVLYPLCILAIWLPCVFLGVAANSLRDVPRIAQKLEARRRWLRRRRRFQEKNGHRFGVRRRATTSCWCMLEDSRRSGSPVFSALASWPR